jgi:hypothetical protein
MPPRSDADPKTENELAAPTAPVTEITPEPPVNEPPFSVIPAVLTALSPKTADPPTNVDDCDVIVTVAVTAAET